MAGQPAPFAADRLVRDLGFGKFHAVQLAVLALQMFLLRIPRDEHVFAARETRYRCDIPECDNFEPSQEPAWLPNAVPYGDAGPSQCLRYEAIVMSDDVTSNLNGSCPKFLFNQSRLLLCSRWIYDDDNTVVRDLEIPCQRWKLTLLAALSGIGECVFLVVAGWLSDACGRKNVFIYSSVVTGFFGFLKSFAPEYVYFGTFQLLTSAASAGASGAGYLLALESTAPDRRVLACITLYVSGVFAAFMLGIVARYISNWRNMYQVIYIPSVFNIIFILFTPESLRWLLAKKRYEEASRMINNIIGINAVRISAKSKVYLDHLKTLSESASRPSEQPSSRKGVLGKSSKLVVRWAACAYCWFVTSLVQYSLSVDMYVTFRFELWINFIITHAIDLVGVLLSVVLLDRVGQRRCLVVCFAWCSVACAVLTFADAEKRDVRLVVLGAARAGLAFTWHALLLLAVEGFPTELRQRYWSACGVLAAVGRMVSLGTDSLASYYAATPFIIYCLLCFICIAVSFKLPDTRQTHLPDTVNEAKELSHYVDSKVRISTVFISGSNDSRW